MQQVVDFSKLPSVVIELVQQGPVQEELVGSYDLPSCPALARPIEGKFSRSWL
jgi:hypothetical protein